MITPNQKARELVEFYMQYVGKSKADPRVAFIKAKRCAEKVCSEILSNMGADRGYVFWSAVKIEIQNLD